MKTETCGCCSGKSNCVVITIETCCKRTCEAYRNANGIQPQGNNDVPRVPSGPIVTEKTSDDEITLAEKASSESLIVEKTISGAVIISKSSDKVKTKSRSKQFVARESSTSSVKFPPQQKEQKHFKLPIVVGRHHGPGCAMEISVLEKHEDSCIYKKEDVGGRNEVDDRVGSYDCIGRMVFRTCNSDELEESPEHLGPGGGDVVSRRTPPRDASPRTYPSVTSGGASFHSASGSQNARLNRAKSKSRSNESAGLRSILEPPVTPKEVTPDQATNRKTRRRSKSREQHVMVATAIPEASTNREVSREDVPEKVIRKHYTGDGCKLHLPRNPLIFGGGNFLQEVSTSKKRFPLYTDEANQTEPTNTVSEEQQKTKSSDETITSLTDISKTEGKRKSNFLGSLFRRSPMGRPDHVDPKKFKN